jgi:DNA-binding transcriptional regulator of glucitol operon
MSLKAVHIVFITCSILLAFFLGGWLWHDYTATKDRTEAVSAVISCLSGLVLIVYAKAILRKLRQVSYL